MSKKKAFTFDDFERKEEDDIELDSNVNEIHNYLDKGSLEAYTISKRKSGTFITVKIKLSE